MFISEYFAYCMADDYADFAAELRLFRMFCSTQSGRSHLDYVKGYESLKYAYDGVFQYAKEQPPEWITRIILPRFTEIEALLNQSSVSSAIISRIALLLLEIEEQDSSGDKTFRDMALDFNLEQDLKSDYSPALYEAVSKSFAADDYDAAVIAAFKYLDSYLQKLLNVSPHDYYGEALINYAYSPNQGLIQMDTHPNEQAGLRNLISGALAVFRNPSAHRFTEYDQFTASTVIALVATVIKLTDKLANERKNP